MDCPNLPTLTHIDNDCSSLFSFTFPSAMKSLYLKGCKSNLMKTRSLDWRCLKGVSQKTLIPCNWSTCTVETRHVHKALVFRLLLQCMRRQRCCFLSKKPSYWRRPVNCNTCNGKMCCRLLSFSILYHRKWCAHRKDDHDDYINAFTTNTLKMLQ